MSDNAQLIHACKEMLDVLKELKECSEYWSEYYVPIGIFDRIDSAIEVGEKAIKFQP